MSTEPYVHLPRCPARHDQTHPLCEQHRNDISAVCTSLVAWVAATITVLRHRIAHVMPNLVSWHGGHREPRGLQAKRDTPVCRPRRLSRIAVGHDGAVCECGLARWRAGRVDRDAVVRCDAFRLGVPRFRRRTLLIRVDLVDLCHRETRLLTTSGHPPIAIVQR